MSRVLGIALAWLLAVIVLPVHAQTRAWLDRAQVGHGETATLNIQTDQSVSSIDYAPLQRQFDVGGQTVRRSYQRTNGRSTSSSLFAVGIRPRAPGVFSVPALRVGNTTTAPLQLTVVAPSVMPASGDADAFVETMVDAARPYVQQAVGVQVRLHYAVPLMSGQLEQDPPSGASLRQVGEDLTYQRQIDGRRYNVVERRFLLIPERSGALTIPGARFSGQGVGGFFDDLFGDGRQDLRTNGAPRVLSVQPPPANAPQPWLPLRSLALRYVSTPQSARAGEAATVTIEADADGASAAQMPELALAAPAGAQVFADPVQARDNFDGGRPQVQLTRKFSIVPGQAGTLRIPGPRIAWWDVRAGIARTASLPDIVLQVAPGTNAANPAPVPVNPAANDAARDGLHLPFARGAVRPWALAAVAFAFLWLATLWWGLHRTTPAVEAQADAKPKPDAARSNKPALAQALAKGDAEAISQALCAAANTPDLDGVRTKLDDPAQQAAVDALQRARWGDGDIASAIAALRAAFKRGPRWKAAAAKAKELLPPLYPE